MPGSLHRRGFLALAAAVLPTSLRAAPTHKIAALFAGKVDDGGFMQAGYEGLKQAESQLGVAVAFEQGVAPKPEELMAALRKLAVAQPSLIIAHGGQNNAAAQAVSADFPDIRFVVTQGNVMGPNLASYEVLQEHSAFLAGMLAGLTTRTGVVGHMSGIRVTPGLKGRAAYLNGVRHADPTVKVLTNFSGNQDDNALSKKVATAMIAAKADIIFTMLNAGRTGAIEACRAGGAKQIGNVRDWTLVVPEVFVASAFADAGRALFNAAQDLVQGRFAAGQIRQIGLESPEAVRLTIAPSVPADTRTRIEAMAAEIVAGRFHVPAEWQGEEFPNPA
jgi:basic membrane protein A